MKHTIREPITHVFDFLIVCGQRVGSHFLATCIAQHPKICMSGEIGREDNIFPDIYSPEPGQLVGAILMYPNIGLLRRGRITTERVIHLIREAESTARSRVRNSVMKKLGISKPHIFNGEAVPRLVKVNERMVRRVRAGYIGERNRVKQWLSESSITYITTSYEELTEGGREVERINIAVAQVLLDFLGLAQWELTTRLRVTGYGKQL